MKILFLQTYTHIYTSGICPFKLGLAVVGKMACYYNEWERELYKADSFSFKTSQALITCETTRDD